MYTAENHRPAPTLQVKCAATPGQEGTVRLYAHVHYMKGNSLKCLLICQSNKIFHPTCIGENLREDSFSGAAMDVTPEIAQLDSGKGACMN